MYCNQWNFHGIEGCVRTLLCSNGCGHWHLTLDFLELAGTAKNQLHACCWTAKNGLVIAMLTE